MSPLKTPARGRTYWRSLDELAQTPEFQEMLGREFPGEAWESLPPATRRQFLKVMGASVALAGLTACRWPEEEIVPFAHRPEGRTPGVPRSFATSFERSGAALGAIVTSSDGRPIKAEGNPLHPDSLGALSAQAQALVLELYDPDRSRRLEYREGGQEYVKTWEEFDAFAAERFGNAPTGGRHVAVLAEASSSPSLSRLKERFHYALPGATWFEYEAVSRDNEREGARLAYGQPVRSLLHLERAAVVACFDADPLYEHPASLAMARAFAASRQPDADPVSRLHVVENSFTITGGMADHRLPIPFSQVAVVLAQVAERLVNAHGVQMPQAAAGLALAVHGVRGAVADTEYVTRLAADLASHRGASLVLVGPRQRPEVHAFAHVLNEALGNVGATVELTDEPDPERPTHVQAIQEVAAGVRGGAIDTLLIVGGNPAYDAPADVGFADMLDRVEVSIHLSLHSNETSRLCSWHLPRAHSLEEWGDGRAWDGTLTLRQPLIEPLYGGRSAIEVVAAVLGAQPVKGYEIVRETMRALLSEDDLDGAWRRALHDGVVADSAWPVAGRSLDAGGLGTAASGVAEMLVADAPSAENLELTLVADSRLHDGRFANIAWLQELPESFTKITWGNALLIGPATAHGLGLADGDVVAVEAAGTAVELPLYVLPGQAPSSLTVALGYGRTAAGEVGSGVGVDTYVVRRSDSLHAVGGVAVRATGRREKLATTQDHHAIDKLGFEARNIRIGTLVREATFDELRADPQVIEHQGHHPPLISLWKEPVYVGEQWGMAIDLNSCIGCNACVTACQAENNIPVVGRQEVGNQREMHWLRIDRYFRSEPGLAPEEVERPDVVFQPVACVHCETAPCEQVCPVAATQHTRDGLNAMAYNRCVGTRYCSNNCPFKVRRFNFFNFHKNLSDVTAMQFNPEVTVRSRGVMEKCSYCIQRIENVRITAGNERRPIGDGEVVPACAQTCPTRAIVFGNLNDPASEVSALREDPRGYAMLAELNIKPRTQYMARLRNPADGGEPSTGSPGHGDSHGKESV